MDTNRNPDVAAVLVIIAASLVVTGKQLLVPGVYSCLREDTIYYLNWTRQFAESLASRVIYPRWMADSHGGFGNPTFVFYPPLTVYLTALVKLASGNIITAATAVKAAGLAMSGVTMFVFARGLWGRTTGIAAALAYMALPFRIYDMYFLGVHASKLAYVWFPLVMHFAGKAATGPRAGRNTALLAASYAALCITHLLSAYMITPVAAAFAILRAEKGGGAPAALRALAGIGLGMLAAAFYLLPVLFERGLVHFEMLLSNDIYHFRNNFLFYVLKSAGPLNPWFYGYLGLTVKASVAAGIAVFAVSLSSGGRRSETVFFLAVTAFTLFLMSSLSSPLWEYTPGMKMLQFPTRWASVLVFAVACIAGAGAGNLQMNAVQKRPLYFGLAATAALAALLWAGYYDYDIITRSCRFTTRDVAAFPKDLDVYEYVPVNVSLEWLGGLKNVPPERRVDSIDQGKPAGIRIECWKPQRREFLVDAAADTEITVRTFYYPGWRALVDGAEVKIGVRPVSGAMLIDVPSGRHEIILTFSETPSRLAGIVISAIAFCMLLYLFLTPLHRHNKDA